MLRILARGGIAFALVAAFGVFAGRACVSALMPLLNLVEKNASPEFASTLHWDAEDPHSLVLAVQFLTPNAQTLALGVKPGSSITTSSHLEHVLVPPILLLALTAAWPLGSLRRSAIALAWALPAAALCVVLTTPFLLTGKIEYMLQGHAMQSGVARATSLPMEWMLLCESGGRWLLAILLALGCVALAERYRGAGRRVTVTM